MLSKLNVDDLDTSHGSKMKVVIGYPAGNVVVRSKFDKETHSPNEHLLVSMADSCQRHLPPFFAF